MGEISRALKQPATADLGDEIARYGPDAGDAAFGIRLGLVFLLGLPAFGFYVGSLEGMWGYFYGSLVLAILVGGPFLYFGAKMLRIRCILYDAGLVFRGYWKVESARFEDVLSVELHRFRGICRFLLTSQDGSKIWLHHLKNIEGAGQRIADLAHVGPEKTAAHRLGKRGKGPSRPPA